MLKNLESKRQIALENGGGFIVKEKESKKDYEVVGEEECDVLVNYLKTHELVEVVYKE